MEILGYVFLYLICVVLSAAGSMAFLSSAMEPTPTDAGARQALGGVIAVIAAGILFMWTTLQIF